MPITKEEKQNYVEQFGKDANDSGAPEVQVAILTHRIRELTNHVKDHKKDHHTRRGLLIMVGRRRRLLNYLKRKNFDRYVAVSKKLNLKITK